MEYTDNKAIYLQIADFICEQVLANKLSSGDRLASVREMAINMEVNPNTIMRTYSYLESKAIIEMQRGVGYFIKQDAYQSVLSIKKEEFMENELPNFFKMIDLLNLPFDEIKQHYDTRTSHEKE